MLACLSAPAAAGAPLPAPQLLDDGDYSETFSLTAYGAAGDVVQLQFGITNLGWGSGRAICRLYVRDAKAPIRKHQMHARKEWAVYGDPVTGLAAPGCDLTAGDHVIFTATIDGVRLAVTTARPLAPVATPQTWLETKGGVYRSQVLLAASAATVAVTRAGAPVRTFSGAAHIDHSVATLLPGTIAAGWLRFRALDGERPLVLSVRLPRGGETFAGWALRESLAPLQVPKPAWWPASAPGSVVPTPLGALQIGRHIEVFEPLRDLGVLRHAAELVVGHPRTLLYWAELDGQAGVLEVATQD